MASFNDYPDGSCRVRIRLKGKSESKSFKSRTEAEHYAGVRESEVLSLKSQTKLNQLPELTFQQVAERYFNSTTFKTKKPSTQKTERTKYKPLLKHFAEAYFYLIDIPAIRDYIELRQSQPSYINNQIRNKNTSYNQVRLEVALLRAIYAYASEYKLVSINPLAGAKLKYIKSDADTKRIPTDIILDIENYAFTYRTRDTQHDTFYNWFVLTYENAFRPGESSRVKLGNINSSKTIISVPSSQTKNKEPFSYFLTQKSQQVVNAQYQYALEHKSPYLFFSISTKTKEIIPFNYYHFWRTMCKALNLSEKYNPHLIRHTKITELFELTTLNAEQIVKITGHKSVLSLKPYLHLRGADYLEHLQKVSDATEQHRVDAFALRALRQVDPNETFTEEQKKNFLVFFQTTKN